MSVNEVVARNDYVGNGTLAGPYTYGFRILTKNDLEVLVDGAVKTVDTDYTVAGVGDSGGGSITFSVAPANLTKIALLRKQPASQLSDYVPNEDFPAERLEKDLDKPAMIAQQTRETLGRAITLAKKSLQKDRVVDDLVLDKFLRVHSTDASRIIMSDVVPAGSIGVPVSVAQGGTGSTTAVAARDTLLADEDARTTTVKVIAIQKATTTGTPAAGIGVGEKFQAESADETPSDFGQLEFAATDVTAGSEDTYFQVLLRVAGAALSAAYRWVATTAFKATFTHANTADRTYTLPNTDQTLTDTLRQTFRTLYVRTHPDNDQAANKVMLVSADEIVMDDGTHVTDFAGQVADIAVAGAGGLDTGAEVASTWYDFYAIRKSTDGTKNLLLHRAKDYFKDEEQATDDTSVSLRQLDGTTERLAQGFQVDTAGFVEFVELKWLRAGTITGNVWVTLETDSAGSPSGTILATSEKKNAGAFETDAAGRVVRLYFRTPVSLSALTQYHVVLRADYTASDTNRLLVRYKATTDPYSRGSFKKFNGTTWSAVVAAGDDAFVRVYVTRNDTAVTMPAGYDQRCLIGQVFNKSDSTFRKFTARNHAVKMDDEILSSGDNDIEFSTNIADQTVTEELMDLVPWRARRVLLGVEQGYSTAPATLQSSQVNIKYETSNTDIIRVNHWAPPSVGVAMAQCALTFTDPGIQRFRWQLASTDAATANKQVIIDLHGYEWS